MDVKINIVNKLSSLVNVTCDRLSDADDNQYSVKPSVNKWSKKEIIGHLCDSAVNNLSRFIRAQFEPEPFKVKGYDQNEWVALNNYNELIINDILNYWQALNRQIIHVIRNIPDDKLAVKLDLGDASFREGVEKENLLWFIEDYVLHMEHHLKQV